MPLSCVINETGPNPVVSILWLHGLGADGHDFAPIVPQLVDPAWPAVRFVFPHAPVRPVTINGGMAMRAWYDIRSLSLSERADAEGVRASIADVEALIAAQTADGIPAERIVVAGFSQGGVIALQAALRHRARLLGVIGLSCYLPLTDALAAERSAANANTPILLMHGVDDPVVPLTLGEHARDTLQAWNYRVEWHPYPMQHQVCLAQILDLRRWLGERLMTIVNAEA